MERKNNIQFNAKLWGKQKFGFRKLSIGLVSVVLGTIFFMNNSHLVKADENSKSASAQPEEQTEMQKQSQKSENAEQNFVNNKTNELNVNDLSNKQIESLIPVKTTSDSLAGSNVKVNNKINNTTDTSTENSEKNNINISKIENPDVRISKIVSSRQDNDSAEKQDLNSKSPTDKNNTIFFNPSQFKNNNNLNWLKENKTIKTSSDLSIKVTPTDEGTKMSGQDNIPVTVNITDNQATIANGDSMTLHFGNSDKFNWNNGSWQNGVTKDLSSGFFAKNNGDGTLTITYKGTTSKSGKLNLSLDLNVIGKVDNGSQLVRVPITLNDDKGKVIGSSTGFKVQFTPYVDKIRKHEIAHIGAVKQVSYKDESFYNPSIVQDIPEDRKNDSNNTKKLMQYMVEFNFDNPSSLNNVFYDQIFSNGQILLPHSIRVFEVDPNILKDAHGNRNTIDAIYAEATKYQNNTFIHEDTTFEKYLRNHIVSSSNGKEITFEESGPFKINGKDYSTNSNNSHSVFLFQMDTLLDKSMPVSWTSGGHGPSVSVNPTSSIKSKADYETQTYTGFNGGGNGYFNEGAFTAKLHFADVNDSNSIKNLDSQSGNSTGIAAPTGDNVTTPIAFNNVAEVIQKLEKLGYIFVGTSLGNETSGKYDGSSYYSITDPSLDKDDLNYSVFVKNKGYGNYDWKAKSFTLNFIHATKDIKESKQVNEVINYVDENNQAVQLAKSYHAVNNPITFTRAYTIDLVTGDITNDADSSHTVIAQINLKTNKLIGNLPAWTISGSFGAKKNAIINGWTVDPTKASQKLNNQNEQFTNINSIEVGNIIFTQAIINTLKSGKGVINNIVITVPYKKDSQPTQPTQSTKTSKPSKLTPGTSSTKPLPPIVSSVPTQPTKVINPTKPVQPTEVQNSKPIISQNHKSSKITTTSKKIDYSYNNRSYAENNPHVREIRDYIISPHKQHGKFSKGTIIMIHGQSSNNTIHAQKINTTLLHNRLLSVAKPKDKKQMANEVEKDIKRNNNGQLPQAGEKQSIDQGLSIFSLIASAILGLFGIENEHKHKQ